MLLSRLARSSRRRIAVMLGLLLTASVVGQQLPCLHAAAGTARAAADAQSTGRDAASTVAPAHGHHHDGMPIVADGRAPATAPATAPAIAPVTTPASTTVPAPHHDPAAPGCAQLMACGLAVSVSASGTIAMNDMPSTSDAPIGLVLQFSAADLEVESPPPRG